MKKTILSSAIAAASMAALSHNAQAQLMIEQTRTFSFVPNGNQVMNFNQFDTMGGTRTLQGILIEIEYDKLGGRLEVDNDSATSGTISLNHSVQANLSSSGPLLLTAGFASIGGSSSMDAVSTLSGVPISATTGDSTSSFNNTGAGDYFLYEPTTVSASTSGNVGSLFFGGYQGTGNYNLTFNATQVASVTGVGGLAQAFVPSSVDGSVKVTYLYVPEPSSAVLGALSVLGLAARRRRR